MKEAKELLERYKSGEISEEELGKLQNWFFYLNSDEIPGIAEEELLLIREQVWARLKQQEPKVLKINYLRKIAAVLIPLVMLLGSAYVLYSYFKTEDKKQIASIIKPGSDKATLTLGDGRTIVLSESNAGILAKKDGLSIRKTNEGQIIYTLDGNTEEIGQYNTLSTGKGEQYSVILPDGTQVWLNSSSSITYEAGKLFKQHRKISLTGEAYFEVAKDKAHPFKVQANDQEVEVLGTHFNISNYPEEADIKTTLLEGMVSVNGKGNGVVLRPGQQAVMEHQTGRMQVKEVTAAYYVAWKQGFFMFNNETLETILNKIGRWYNVTIVFEDPTIKNKTFFGTISRYEKIEKVLNMLEGTETVSFKIEGHTILVDKKDAKP